MKGRALSEYRLNFYHSVRFTATKPQKATIDALVAADRRSAKGTEERKKGRNASTILTLPQRGKTNRFLCYLTKQKGRAVVTTLAYMVLRRERVHRQGKDGACSRLERNRPAVPLQPESGYRGRSAEHPAGTGRGTEFFRDG